MVVESNNAKWLAWKSHASFSTKTKTNHTLYARFFPRFEQITAYFSRNSDWFIAPFAPVVIGRNNYLGTGFSTVIWKPLYIHIFLSNTRIRLCVDAYDVRLRKWTVV